MMEEESLYSQSIKSKRIANSPVVKLGKKNDDSYEPTPTFDEE